MCRADGLDMELMLLRNKAEMKLMSIFECDEEAVRKALKEEAYEDGGMNGRTEAVLGLPEELGPVPEELNRKIMDPEDEKTLKKWLKLAAKAERMEAFCEEMYGCG